MTDFVMRDTQHQEAKYVVGMIPEMILDMHRHGGGTAARDEADRNKLTADITGDHSKILIAETEVAARVS
jgi:hypothetical protein